MRAMFAAKAAVEGAEQRAYRGGALARRGGAEGGAAPAAGAGGQGLVSGNEMEKTSGKATTAVLC